MIQLVKAMKVGTKVDVDLDVSDLIFGNCPHDRGNFVAGVIISQASNSPMVSVHIQQSAYFAI